MRTLTIEEALTLDAGMPVTAIEGKVVWVGERKSGLSKKTGKEWSFQDAILVDPELDKDDPNGKITIKFEFKDDMSHLKGKDIKLSSYQGKRGVEGVMKLVEDYQGKEYHKLAVKVDPEILGETQPQANTGGQSSNPSQSTNETSKTSPTQSYAPKDYVDETLCHFMGTALRETLDSPDSDGKANEDIMAEFAVAMYRAKLKAAKIIRES